MPFSVQLTHLLTNQLPKRMFRFLIISTDVEVGWCDNMKDEPSDARYEIVYLLSEAKSRGAAFLVSSECHLPASFCCFKL